MTRARAAGKILTARRTSKFRVRDVHMRGRSSMLLERYFCVDTGCKTRTED
jgi:hypothetical protein